VSGCRALGDRDGRSARKADEFVHVGDVEIADAPVPDLARAEQRLERIECLRERRIAAPVQQVEIKPVDPETPQAATTPLI
jgi:hypothetical protein